VLGENKLKKSFVIMMIFGLASSVVHAEENGVLARKDINKLFFGGQEKTLRLVSFLSACEVIIRNDPEAKMTEIVMNGRDEETFFTGKGTTFSVVESDPNLIMGAEHDFEKGIISLATGNHHTSSLQIIRKFSGLRKSFHVSIFHGFGFPKECEVF